jgi:beta-phosphoglucomutase family hydrolase
VTAPQSPLAPGLALIFDMDGVIVNSNPFHRQAWEVFNRRYGLETTEAMHDAMYGKWNGDIVRGFFGADLSDEEVVARGAAKEAVYRELIAHRLHEMLVPGISSFLELYRPCPMAVASNAEPENIRLILDNAGLRGFFQVVVDGHQVALPKPNPEIYLRVAQLLQIRPENCIVFEDSYVGVQSALAAGMRVVGIRTTHGDLPGTNLTVDNFDDGDLRRWLAEERVAGWR